MGSVSGMVTGRGSKDESKWGKWCVSISINVILKRKREREKENTLRSYMFPNLVLCCYPWKVRRIVLIKIESYQVKEDLET